MLESQQLFSIRYFSNQHLFVTLFARASVILSILKSAIQALHLCSLSSAKCKDITGLSSPTDRHMALSLPYCLGMCMVLLMQGQDTL